MKNIVLGLVSFFLLVSTAYASPMTHTINFNNIPTGSGLDGNPVDIEGVVFDGWIIAFGAAGSILTPVTSAPSITFASPVTLLGFDYWSLFNVDLNVDGTSYPLLPTFTGETFSTSAIAKELSFQAVEFPYVGAVGLDNLTYENIAQTPIPGALALLCAGMFGIAGLRKKFQQ